MAILGPAFQTLGYKLPNVRTYWSAESETGICLTLWDALRDPNFDRKRFDSKKNGRSIIHWGHKQGNTFRKRHIQQAIGKFNSWVDVVLLFEGTSKSRRVDRAEPWCLPEHQGRWRVTCFEANTGHFAIELLDVEGRLL
jgi:hypothetical protein